MNKMSADAIKTKNNQKGNNLMKFSLRDSKRITLDARGVSHIIVPLLAVVVMAVGGTYALVASHADASTPPATAAAKAQNTCATEATIDAGFWNGTVATLSAPASDTGTYTTNDLESYNNIYYNPPTAANLVNYVQTPSKQYDGTTAPTYSGLGTVMIYENGKLTPVKRVNYGLILARQQSALAALQHVDADPTGSYARAVANFAKSITTAQTQIKSFATSWPTAPGTFTCTTAAGVADPKAVKNVEKYYKKRAQDFTKLAQSTKKVDSNSKKASAAYQKEATAYQKAVKKSAAAVKSLSQTAK
jgi:hypothetical protein